MNVQNRPAGCISQGCPELREREGASGAARKYCNLDPTRCITNIITCPKIWSPLNCRTCNISALDCRYKHLHCYDETGCASHTDVNQHILKSIPTADLVRELFTRQDVKVARTIPDGTGCFLVNANKIDFTTAISGPARILVIPGVE